MADESSGDPKSSSVGERDGDIYVRQDRHTLAFVATSLAAIGQSIGSIAGKLGKVEGARLRAGLITAREQVRVLREDVLPGVEERLRQQEHKVAEELEAESKEPPPP